jgi:catechol 2,3-dioxygenase-like lactoylglutathione lyase family enzyme
MRVSHVILRVADLDRSVEFYRDRLGLKVLGRSEAFAFLDGAAIQVALNQGPGHQPDVSQTEIVLEVEHVAAEFQAMRDRGIPFQVQLREVMGAGDRSLYAAHFADPDGHLWSLTGWVDTHQRG